MTSGRFSKATREDFDRSMSQLASDKLEEMLVGRLHIQSEATKANALSNSRYPLMVMVKFDEVFRAFLSEAAERAATYIGRLGNSALVAAYLRPHLEWLLEKCLQEIPNAVGMADPLRDRYRPMMSKRMDDVLQDLVVGVVNGRTVPGAAPQAATRLFELKPGFWGMRANVDEMLRRLRRIWRGDPDGT